MLPELNNRNLFSSLYIPVWPIGKFTLTQLLKSIKQTEIKTFLLFLCLNY